MYKVRKKNKKIEARICSTETFYRSNGGMEIRSTPELMDAAAELNQHLTQSKGYADFANIRKLHLFFDKVARSIGGGRSVCQRGCAHCCNLDIDLGFFEARYIAHHLDLTLIDRTTRTRSNYGYEKGNYCQFLNQRTAECTIYKIRPIVCRSFIVFDSPEYCADRNYPTHALHHIGNSAFHLFYDRLIGSAHGKVADIREWFVEYNKEPYKEVFSKDVELTFEDDE